MGWYKVHIYDNPQQHATALHTYVVIATPVQNTPLLAHNLPVIAMKSDVNEEPQVQQHLEKYMLKVVINQICKRIQNVQNIQNI